MTIGQDASNAAVEREEVANSGFATSSAVNLGLQATELISFTAYLESIKAAIQTSVINTGRYRGAFTLHCGLLNTTGLPPPHPVYMIEDAEHPYNAAWTAFAAWATSQDLFLTLLSDSMFILPPPDEGYAFDLVPSVA